MGDRKEKIGKRIKDQGSRFKEKGKNRIKD